MSVDSDVFAELELDVHHGDTYAWKSHSAVRLGLLAVVSTSDTEEAELQLYDITDPLSARLIKKTPLGLQRPFDVFFVGSQEVAVCGDEVVEVYDVADLALSTRYGQNGATCAASMKGQLLIGSSTSLTLGEGEKEQVAYHPGEQNGNFLDIDVARGQVACLCAEGAQYVCRVYNASLELSACAPLHSLDSKQKFAMGGRAVWVSDNMILCSLRTAEKEFTVWALTFDGELRVVQNSVSTIRGGWTATARLGTMLCLASDIDMRFGRVEEGRVEVFEPLEWGSVGYTCHSVRHCCFFKGEDGVARLGAYSPATKRFLVFSAEPDWENDPNIEDDDEEENWGAEVPDDGNEQTEPEEDEEAVHVPDSAEYKAAISSAFASTSTPVASPFSKPFVAQTNTVSPFAAFAAGNAKPSANSAFGAAPASAFAPSALPVFGQPTGVVPTSSSLSVFGQTKETAAAPSALSAFGKQKDSVPAPSPLSVFGLPGTATNANSVFGTSSAAAPPEVSVFGKPKDAPTPSPFAAFATNETGTAKPPAYSSVFGKQEETVPAKPKDAKVAIPQAGQFEQPEVSESEEEEASEGVETDGEEEDDDGVQAPLPDSAEYKAAISSAFSSTSTPAASPFAKPFVTQTNTVSPFAAFAAGAASQATAKSAFGNAPSGPSQTSTPAPETEPTASVKPKDTASVKPKDTGSATPPAATPPAPALGLSSSDTKASVKPKDTGVDSSQPPVKPLFGNASPASGGFSFAPASSSSGLGQSPFSGFNAPGPFGGLSTPSSTSGLIGGQSSSASTSGPFGGLPPLSSTSGAGGFSFGAQAPFGGLPSSSSTSVAGGLTFGAQGQAPASSDPKVPFGGLSSSSSTSVASGFSFSAPAGGFSFVTQGSSSSQTLGLSSPSIPPAGSISTPASFGLPSSSSSSSATSGASFGVQAPTSSLSDSKAVSPDSEPAQKRPPMPSNKPAASLTPPATTPENPEEKMMSAFDRQVQSMDQLFELRKKKLEDLKSLTRKTDNQFPKDSDIRKLERESAKSVKAVDHILAVSDDVCEELKRISFALESYDTSEVDLLEWVNRHCPQKKSLPKLRENVDVTVKYLDSSITNIHKRLDQWEAERAMDGIQKIRESVDYEKIERLAQLQLRAAKDRIEIVRKMKSDAVENAAPARAHDPKPPAALRGLAPRHSEPLRASLEILRVAAQSRPFFVSPTSEERLSFTSIQAPDLSDSDEDDEPAPAATLASSAKQSSPPSSTATGVAKGSFAGFGAKAPPSSSENVSQPSTASTPGGFGATPAPSSSSISNFGGFGGAPASSASTGFGGLSAIPVSSSSSATALAAFGSVPASSSTATGFGGFEVKPASSSSSAPGFGGLGATAGFGGLGATPASSSSSATGFGGFSMTPASSSSGFGGFGGTPAPSSTSATGIGGFSTTPAAGGFGSTFGSTAASSSISTGGGGFTIGNTSSSGFGFGQTSSSGFGGFGVKPASSSSPATGFGGFGTTPASSSSSASGFGGLGATPASSSSSATGFGGFSVTPGFGGFGGTPASSSSSTTPFGGFGVTSASPASSASPFGGFGGPSGFGAFGVSSASSSTSTPFGAFGSSGNSGFGAFNSTQGGGSFSCFGAPTASANPFAAGPATSAFSAFGSSSSATQFGFGPASMGVGSKPSVQSTGSAFGSKSTFASGGGFSAFS